MADASSSSSKLLKVFDEDGITCVQFIDKQLLDEARILLIQDELTAVIAGKHPPLLLIDFYNIEHLSSAMLGTLVVMHKRIKEKKGHLRLANITPKLLKIFTLTNLDKVLRISSTRTGARSILHRMAKEGAMDSP